MMAHVLRLASLAFALTQGLEPRLAAAHWSTVCAGDAQSVAASFAEPIVAAGVQLAPRASSHERGLQRLDLHRNIAAAVERGLDYPASALQHARVLADRPRLASCPSQGPPR